MQPRWKQIFSTAIHMLWIGASCFVAGCGQKEATPESAKQFRVALLTPGPISDQSWNGGAYQGLMRIKDSLSATVSHIQTKTPAEFEQQFRQYGSQGYD